MEEFIKLDNDFYEGRDVSWPRTFGMQNFMIVGTENHQKLMDLACEGKTIDGYDSEQGYIVKPMSEIETVADYFEGVYYQLERPVMVDQDLCNKLLVWFSPFPARYDAPVEMRIFSHESQRWPSLSKRLANNTFILRLADSNLISGSFFQNTENFPDYEEIIQRLICNIAEDCGVAREEILLYGDSRGGTGAFIHALLGQYPAVLLDPLMDRRTLDDGKWDTALAGDFTPQNFVARINQLLDVSNLTKDQIKVVSSDSLVGNYPYLKQLNLTKFTLMNLAFKMFAEYNSDRAHGVFVTSNFPLALQYMNEFFYKTDLTIETSNAPLYLQDWSVHAPFTNRAFTFDYQDDGLLVVRSDYETTEKLVFKLKQPMIKGQYYRIQIESDRPLSNLTMLLKQAEREEVKEQILDFLEEGSVLLQAEEDWTALAIERSPDWERMKLRKIFVHNQQYS